MEWWFCWVGLGFWGGFVCGWGLEDVGLYLVVIVGILFELVWLWVCGLERRCIFLCEKG